MMSETMNDASYGREDRTVILHANAGSDFVVSPITGKACASTAFLYQPMKGDFILQTGVSRRFLSTYDAPALVAMESETRWMKVCFEYTDPRTRAVVSAITGTTSDDCNGVEADSDSIWLQLCHENHIFMIHYSLDGVHWRMYRMLRVEMEEKLKVSLVAQNLLGYGGDFILEKVSLKPERKAGVRGGD